MKLIKQLTEMAREAKICPKCGKKITGNHYWYKGEWKCKKSTDEKQEPTTTSKPEQEPEVQQQDVPDDPITHAQTFEEEQEISAEILPFLEHEIEKLNKRARKLAVPEIHLEQVGEPIFKEYKVKEDDGTTTTHKRKYLKIKVHGETPKLADWLFVATINHKGEETILNVAPGQDGSQLKRFHKAKASVCDHCKKARRRVDTYIVKNTKTGELKQVGRNCIRDFLGGKDPKNILWYMSLFDTIKQLFRKAEQGEGGEHFGGARFHPHAETLDAVAFGVELVNKFGYRSAQAASEGGQSTSGDIRFGLFGRLSPKPTEKEKQLWSIGRQALAGRSEEKYKQEAQEIIEWAKNIPEQSTDKEPFLHNIKVIAKSSHVSSREIGYVAGMIIAAHKAQAKVQLQKQQAQKSNEHVGQVGQKITAKVKVVGVTQLEQRYYGTPATKIVRMEDEKGNMIVWFSSTGAAFEKGEEFEITGTVKKLDEYQGRKQTVITRAKIK